MKLETFINEYRTRSGDISVTVADFLEVFTETGHPRNFYERDFDGEFLCKPALGKFTVMHWVPTVGGEHLESWMEPATAKCTCIDLT